MPRSATIPIELTRGPFTLQEAGAAGITASALRSRPWKRVGKAIYRWESAPDDPWLLIAAWRRSLGTGVTFSGYTAAWMHGLECNPSDPIEVAAPTGASLRSCRGLAVRHCDLPRHDVSRIRGATVTAVLRTLRDLCLSRPPLEALIVLDNALHRSVADRVAIWRYARETTGLPGAARMRHLASFAEPAESPMETRLRWLLLAAGLPRPEVQRELRDHKGQFLGRADLYYPNARLIVEFDGGNHRERLVTDDRRQNLLVNAGFRVLRFTSPDLLARPTIVIAQVRNALVSDPDSARKAQNVPKQAA